MEQNSRQITLEINLKKYAVNTDLMPVAYFAQIKSWLTLVEGKSFPVPVIALILFMMITILYLSFRRISPVTIGIFAGGLAGASLEFLILMLYQIIFGYIYQMTGLIMAFYMAGLTSGAFIKTDVPRKTMMKWYVIIQLVLFGMVLLFPVLSIGAIRLPIHAGWIVQATLLLFTASVALIAGFEFNLASKLENADIERVAGSLYGIDLAGAAFGTFFVSLLFYPLLGLTGACLLIALIVMTSLLVMIIYRKLYL